MTLLGLIQIVVNIFIGLAVAILWIRQFRPAKEDPRLSRGLQLLQSKISVLEDLSDRTESQVKQLTQILDERAKILQTKMLQAEETLQKIEHSIHRSLDVAEIFQDKIPHQEIIERNQQSKYVLAAKMANEGHSVDEIAQEVDLPKNEIEFIAKVNREELTFSPDLLPDWAKVKPQKKQELEAQMVDRVFHSTPPDLTALHKIESDFKSSLREAEEAERKAIERARQMDEKAEALKQSAQSAIIKTQDMIQNAVRKVNFPRITVDRAKMPRTIVD